MKRTLLHFGVVLAALGATALSATAQDTPFVPPLNLNEVAITGSGYSAALSDDCVKWNANESDGANSHWSVESNYNYSKGIVFRFAYQAQYPETNDWLFLPDMQLDAAQYDITFDCWKNSDSYTEIVDFTLGKGKNVEAHTGDGKVDVAHVEMPKNVQGGTSVKSYSYRVSVPEGGVYNFGLQCTSERNAYYVYVGNLTITKVDPAAPETASLSVATDGLDATVTVTFPTSDVSGNSLPAGIEMTASISIEGSDMTATLTGTPGSSASADFTFPKSSTQTALCVVTYTDADGLHTSATSASEPFVVQKKPLSELPDGYTLIPDNDEGTWATFVDANDDGKTFYYNPSTSYNHIPINLTLEQDEGLWVYEFPNEGAADEWLISPVWAGSTTGALKITYGVGTYYGAASDYDVCLATSADIAALGANVIFSETDLNTGHYPEYREVFTQVTPGTQYYIAFHLKTPVREGQSTSWYTGFFRLHSESIDGTIPAAATFSEFEKDYTHAGLSFSITLPTKDVMGNDLTDSVVYADITMTDNDEPETVSGAPGAVIEKSYTELTIGKYYDFTVHTYRLDGEEKVGDRTVTATTMVEVDDTYTFKAPVMFNFGVSATFDLCTVIDANGDGTTFQNVPGDCAKIKWNSSMAMDDWLITKGIEVNDANELYTLVLKCRNSSSNYAERCELYWGTEPTIEAMTNLVFREDLTSGSISSFYKDIKFDAPCTIFLGVHGCSDANMLNLEVFEAGLVAHETAVTDPGEVTDIVADGKKSGEAVAEVSFKFPVNSYGELVEVEPDEPAEEPVEGGDPVVTVPVYERVGQPLKADLQLTAVVASATESKTVTGTPGQEVTVELAAPQGTSEITIFVQSPEYTYTPADDTNGDGVVDDSDDNAEVTVPAGQGPKTVTAVYCGLHTPRRPAVSAAPVPTDDNLGFTVTWEAVTECANEGETHLNAENLVYRLYQVDLYTDQLLPIAETSELSATVRLDQDDLGMGMRIYALTAYNGLESATEEFAAVIGQPEALPLSDFFEEGSPKGMFLLYGWADFVEPASAGAPATETNMALLIEEDQDVTFELPKFSTEGVNQGYVEFTYFAEANTPEAVITAQANGDAEATVLGTLQAAEGESGWKSVYFNYPAELLNRKAVAVKGDVSIATGQKFMLDGYEATNYAKVGLDNVSALAGASARGLEGAILLQGFAGHEVAVCTPDGRVVATVNAADDSETVAIGAGIYVVSADGFAAKVAVK